jgi:hypothetical protein
MLECVLFVDVHHVSNALTDAVGVRFTYWNKDYKIRCLGVVTGRKNSENKAVKR